MFKFYINNEFWLNFVSFLCIFFLPFYYTYYVGVGIELLNLSEVGVESFLQTLCSPDSNNNFLKAKNFYRTLLNRNRFSIYSLSISITVKLNNSFVETNAAISDVSNNYCTSLMDFRLIKK